MIEGVIITPLKQIEDDRGKVMHMLREDSKVFQRFGEIYFSFTNSNSIKAWHMHKEMTLNYVCIEGKVKFVFRDFPFNYPALLGSMVMRCIPNDVRYDYMNALYKLQKNWVNRDPGKTKSELYKIMQSGGMNKDEFDECISDINLENDILEGVMNAQREFNIQSTPSFLVNGVLYSGNKDIKEFRQIIDKILSQ